MMAALRRALLAGALAAAAPAAAATAGRDVQSLVQKGLDVHHPADAAVNLVRTAEELGLQDSLEEPPHSVVRRIAMEVEAELPRVIEPIMGSLTTLLNIVFKPVSVMNEDPAALYMWTADKFAEHCAGLLVAFRDPKFAGHLTQSVEEIAGVVADFGEDLTEVAEEIVTKTGQGDVSDAKYWLEHSVYQSGDAHVRASGRFFDRWAALLQGLPTEFLQQSAKTSKRNAEQITERSVRKGFRTKLEPGIKSFFEVQDHGSLCKSLTSEVGKFSKMADRVRGEAVMAIVDMHEQLVPLEPYIKVGAPRQADLILKTIRGAMDTLKGSVQKLGVGMHIWSGAFTEAMLTRMNCTA